MPPESSERGEGRASRRAASGHHARAPLVATLAAICGILIPQTGRAEYLLRPGDVLEISIVGMPEARARSPISLDGTSSVPLAGNIKAEGMTVDAFRAAVQQLLSSKRIRRYTANGQEVVSVIDPDEIGVSIASYRPVYLSGDISKPGQQEFRPGMSVKQAISLAGGYDIMRIRMDNPFLSAIDQKAEYEASRAAYIRQLIEAARLEAELANASSFSGEGLEIDRDSAFVQNLLSLERERFETRREEKRKELQSLRRRLDLGREQLAELREQVAKEKEGVQLDTAELTRVSDLLSKGSTVAPRVTDARRSLLLSSTRVLQTTAQIAATQREFEDVSRKLDRIEDDRRLEVAEKLQTARLEVESLKSKLSGLGDKLVYSGMVKSQLVRDNVARPEIEVTRMGPKGPERIKASEGTVLDPGDIIEVSLQASYFRDPPAIERASPARAAAPEAATRRSQ